MWRNTVSKIIKASRNAGENAVNRTLTSKTPENVDSVVSNNRKVKPNLLEKKNKPMDNKMESNPSKQKAPYVKAESPCKEAEKKRQAEARAKPEVGKSDRDDNCAHHKKFIPPACVLSQMKSFELKSNCSSFHMKSTGHDKK